MRFQERNEGNLTDIEDVAGGFLKLHTYRELVLNRFILTLKNYMTELLQPTYYKKRWSN